MLLIKRVIFSLNLRVQTVDFGKQGGFLLDGEDPHEKVNCRKESYFLEFKYVDVARDFAGVVFHVLFDSRGQGAFLFSFIHSLIHWFVRSLVRSFVRSFGCSFIHSFFYPVIPVMCGSEKSFS